MLFGLNATFMMVVVTVTYSEMITNFKRVIFIIFTFILVLDETRESIPSSMLDSEWWQAIVAIHQQQIANNYVAKLVIIF